MLARPETRRCIECGLSYESPAFSYWYGDPEKGAAYFSDRGVLCSPKCSLVHFERRRAEGTYPDLPAADPDEFEQMSDPSTGKA